ncbi:hypothetical protein BCR33DRAFT_718441 [Rhizoclosmatium globosum]|uniref:Uncharacterized protein n=1 Tax=Rhizoclosmatium globosum TaxID=329046 RepID=A0A1Y2C5D0_9FUNG|nr:hypothetical protein BCR33DRAFT_718441 [Rhizoclosmatium globosum]|eukprot:ORY42250.1 hypothetical protein BCR33DRAFT_718441 [Rhizoclosmatium globosum]
MVVPTGFSFYQEAQCSSPLLLVYSIGNGTDCTPEIETPTCTQDPKRPGWYYKSACATEGLITFGNKYFPNIAQYQSMQTGLGGCDADVLGGYQFPFGACVRVPSQMIDPIGGYPILSMKATIDPSSPLLNYYWGLYTDATCTTFLVDQSGNLPTPSNPNPNPLGVNNSPGCYDNHKQRVLNFGKKFAGTTVYSGPDCKTPAKLYYSTVYNTTCSDVSTCTQDSTTGEWYTSTCSDSYDLSLKTATTWPDATKYISYKKFNDVQCYSPLSSENILLDTCFPSGGLGNSVKASISVLGIKLTTYTGSQSCTGSSSDLILSIDQTCTLGAGSSALAETKNALAKTAPSVLSTPAPITPVKNESSGPSVGLIAGIAAGVVVVLAAVGFFVWSRKNKVSQEPGIQLVNGDVSRKNGTTFGRSFSLGQESSTVDSPPRAAPTTYSSIPAPMGTVRASESGNPSIFHSTDQSSMSVIHSMGTSREEKQGSSNLFSGLNDAVSDNSRSAKHREAYRQDGYAMFGELELPDTPSNWSVQNVIQWVEKNEGTPEILRFIYEQEIDGRALLLMKVEEFSFPTIGRRIRFKEALESLRSINENRLRTFAPLPSFSEATGLPQ